MYRHLTQEQIRHALATNLVAVSDDNLFPHLMGLVPKSAAVLIPLTKMPDGWHILYTRRTDRVESHKGQVSFPGGAKEAQDADMQATALRETVEEIGLAPEHVTVLGSLPTRLTVSNYIVTPVVGVFESPYEFKANRFEVQHIFTIPLQWLANSNHFTSYTYDETSNIVYRYAEYNGETVWGITAKITLDLIRTLGILV